MLHPHPQNTGSKPHDLRLRKTSIKEGRRDVVSTTRGGEKKKLLGSEEQHVKLSISQESDKKSPPTKRAKNLLRLTRKKKWKSSEKIYIWCTDEQRRISRPANAGRGPIDDTSTGRNRKAADALLLVKERNSLENDAILRRCRYQLEM